MKKSAFVLLAVVTVVLMGCDSPERTVDTLRKEISAFQAAPDDEKQAAIEKNFARLDEQIIALKKKGDRDKADSYEEQEANLRSDYQAAKLGRAVQDAKKAIQGFGEAIKSDVKSIGDAFKGSTTNK